MKVNVSDHALVRYVERVYGIDLETVRKAIEDAALPAASVKAASYINDGWKYVLSYPCPGVATVVTVAEKNMRTKSCFSRRSA
jgi:hypothetical protein